MSLLYLIDSIVYMSTNTFEESLRTYSPLIIYTFHCRISGISSLAFLTAPEDQSSPIASRDPVRRPILITIVVKCSQCLSTNGQDRLANAIYREEAVLSGVDGGYGQKATR